MIKRILVTGGTGMVGIALKEILPDAAYISRAKESDHQADLTSYTETLDAIRRFSPEIIIHLAAKVAGLEYNISHPVEQLDINLAINSNVIRAAHRCGVSKMLAMASTCIYPENPRGYPNPYPIKEEMLHDGNPPATNFEYAYAKRVMCAQIDAYRKQYGYKWSYLIPSNVYGPGDNYKEGESHFIGSLIREYYKYWDDKSKSFVNLPGTGRPIRQFLYSKDLARVIKLCIEKDIYEPINVVGESLSYLEASKYFSCPIHWDLSKPDGQYRKDGCEEKFKKYFPDFTMTPFSEGIQETCRHYSSDLSKKQPIW